MGDLTEKNNDTLINAIIFFANNYPIYTIIIVIIIAITIAILAKGDFIFTLFGKHQTVTNGDAVMDSTYEKKKKKSQQE